MHIINKLEINTLANEPLALSDTILLSTQEVIQADSALVFEWLTIFLDKLSNGELSEAEAYSKVKAFIDFRWHYLAESNIHFLAHPNLPANKACELAFAPFACKDKAICQLLMPTLVDCFNDLLGYSLKEATEYDGAFIPAQYMLSDDKTTVLDIAELFNRALINTDNIFSDYQQTAKLDIALTSNELYRLRFIAGKYSQKLFNQLENHHRHKHLGQSFGSKLREFANKLKLSSKMELGTKDDANLPILIDAINDFYLYWQALPNDIKETAGSYSIISFNSQPVTLYSYLMTIFSGSPDCALTPEQIAIAFTDRLKCTNELQIDLIRLLTEHPELYQINNQEAPPELPSINTFNKLKNHLAQRKQSAVENDSRFLEHFQLGQSLIKNMFDANAAPVPLPEYFAGLLFLNKLDDEVLSQTNIVRADVQAKLDWKVKQLITWKLFYKALNGIHKSDRIDFVKLIGEDLAKLHYYYFDVASVLALLPFSAWPLLKMYLGSSLDNRIRNSAHVSLFLVEFSISFWPYVLTDKGLNLAEKLKTFEDYKYILSYFELRENLAIVDLLLNNIVASIKNISQLIWLLNKLPVTAWARVFSAFNNGIEAQPHPVFLEMDVDTLTSVFTELPPDSWVVLKIILSQQMVNILAAHSHMLVFLEKVLVNNTSRIAIFTDAILALDDTNLLLLLQKLKANINDYPEAVKQRLNNFTIQEIKGIIKSHLPNSHSVASDELMSMVGPVLPHVIKTADDLQEIVIAFPISAQNKLAAHFSPQDMCALLARASGPNDFQVLKNLWVFLLTYYVEVLDKEGPLYKFIVQRVIARSTNDNKVLAEYLSLLPISSCVDVILAVKPKIPDIYGLNELFSLVKADRWPVLKATLQLQIFNLFNNKELLIGFINNILPREPQRLLDTFSDLILSLNNRDLLIFFYKIKFKKSDDYPEAIKERLNSFTVQEIQAGITEILAKSVSNKDYQDCLDMVSCALPTIVKTFSDFNSVILPWLEVCGYNMVKLFGSQRILELMTAMPLEKNDIKPSPEVLERLFMQYAFSSDRVSKDITSHILKEIISDINDHVDFIKYNNVFSIASCQKISLALNEKAYLIFPDINSLAKVFEQSSVHNLDAISTAFIHQISTLLDGRENLTLFINNVPSKSPELLLNTFKNLVENFDNKEFVEFIYYLNVNCSSHYPLEMQTRLKTITAQEIKHAINGFEEPAKELAINKCLTIFKSAFSSIIKTFSDFSILSTDLSEPQQHRLVKTLDKKTTNWLLGNIIDNREFFTYEKTFQLLAAHYFQCLDDIINFWKLSELDIYCFQFLLIGVGPAKIADMLGEHYPAEYNIRRLFNALPIELWPAILVLVPFKVSLPKPQEIFQPLIDAKCERERVVFYQAASGLITICENKSLAVCLILRVLPIKYYADLDYFLAKNITHYFSTLEDVDNLFDLLSPDRCQNILSRSDSKIIDLVDIFWLTARFSLCNNSKGSNSLPLLNACTVIHQLGRHVTSIIQTALDLNLALIHLDYLNQGLLLEQFNPKGLRALFNTANDVLIVAEPLKQNRFLPLLETIGLEYILTLFNDSNDFVKFISLAPELFKMPQHRMAWEKTKDSVTDCDKLLAFLKAVKANQHLTILSLVEQDFGRIINTADEFIIILQVISDLEAQKIFIDKMAFHLFRFEKQLKAQLSSSLPIAGLYGYINDALHRAKKLQPIIEATTTVSSDSVAKQIAAYFETYIKSPGWTLHHGANKNLAAKIVTVLSAVYSQKKDIAACLRSIDCILHGLAPLFDEKGTFGSLYKQMNKAPGSLGIYDKAPLSLNNPNFSGNIEKMLNQVGTGISANTMQQLLASAGVFRNVNILGIGLDPLIVLDKGNPSHFPGTMFYPSSINQEESSASRFIDGPLKDNQPIIFPPHDYL